MPAGRRGEGQTERTALRGVQPDPAIGRVRASTLRAEHHQPPRTHRCVRCAASTAVDEEPARLRGHRLRRQAGRPGALGRGVRLLRRLLRRVERGLPRQRRARHRGRPSASDEAAPTDRERRAGPRAALQLAAVLGVVAVALVVPLGPGVAGAALRLRGAPARLHARAQACRPRRRVRDRGTLRRARGRRRGSGRSADLALAAPLHGSARAVPRRWASDAPSSCSSSLARRQAVVSSTATPSL